MCYSRELGRSSPASVSHESKTHVPRPAQLAGQNMPRHTSCSGIHPGVDGAVDGAEVGPRGGSLTEPLGAFELGRDQAHVHRRELAQLRTVWRAYKLGHNQALIHRGARAQAQIGITYTGAY